MAALAPAVPCNSSVPLMCNSKTGSPLFYTESRICCSTSSAVCFGQRSVANFNSGKLQCTWSNVYYDFLSNSRGCQSLAVFFFFFLSISFGAVSFFSLLFSLLWVIRLVWGRHIKPNRAISVCSARFHLVLEQPNSLGSWTRSLMCPLS